MKVSLNWLKDYVKFDLSDRDYAELMTGTGTKVETIERLGEDIENVVAGRINSVTPHPDSDHLVICIVDVGGEKPLQIVTGAQNVNAGDLVPVCLNGAKLPGGKVIKTGKLRGVVSEGMLCSLSELGLTVHDFPYAIEDGIFMQELGNFFIGKSFGRKKQKENAPRFLLERFDQVGDYLFSQAVSS